MPVGSPLVGAMLHGRVAAWEAVHCWRCSAIWQGVPTDPPYARRGLTTMDV